MLNHFHPIPERDGQTDEQICYINVACSVLTCDKNTEISALLFLPFPWDE